MKIPITALAVALIGNYLDLQFLVYAGAIVFFFCIIEEWDQGIDSIEDEIAEKVVQKIKETQ